MKVAIYTRVSTQFQVNKESLPQQRRDLTIYAEHVLNIPDYVIFEETGYSGKNTNRPAYQEMMDRIRKHEFTHLLVYKIDRINRNLLDFHNMYSELKKLGVTFISKNEQFDTSSAMGEAMLKIILVFAELERKMTSERVYNVFLSRASQGLPIGGQMPFGYHYNPETKQISIVPDEAEIVKYIFDAYPKCGSTMKLADHLIELGIKNRNGNYFNNSTIHSVLSNQFYTGDMVYNKFDNSLNKMRKRTEWMVYENHHEPIISKETFQKTKDLLTSKRKAHASPLYKYEHIFSGLITCAECGNVYHSHITEQRDSGYKPSIYICYGRYRKEGGCKNKSVSDVRLGPFVFTFIRNVLNATHSVTEHTTLSALNAKLLRGECFKPIERISEESLTNLKKSILRKNVNYYDPPEPIPIPSDKVINDLQKERQKNETALTRLMNLYLYDPTSISEAEYVLKKSQITDSIKKIDDEIRKVKKTTPEKNINEMNLESYTATVEALTKGKNFDFTKYIQSVNATIPKDFLNHIFTNISVRNGLPETITFVNGIVINFIQKEKPASIT